MKLKEFIKLVDTTKFAPITVMNKLQTLDGGDLVSAGGKIDQKILKLLGNDEVDKDMDPNNLQRGIYNTYVIALADAEEKQPEKPKRIFGMTKKEIKAICKKHGLDEKTYPDKYSFLGIHGTNQVILTNRKCQLRRIDKKQYIKDCKAFLEMFKTWEDAQKKGFSRKELAMLCCKEALIRFHPSFLSIRYQECVPEKIEKEITISSRIIEEVIEIMKEEV